MVLTLLLIVFLGSYSGKKVQNSQDFSVTGRKAGSILVAGTIMGTLVGGASTVGTAQLAFMYGFSAWWFTLGGGIACFFLGIFLARPLWQRTEETVTGILQTEYGRAAGVLAVIFVSLGIFFNIVPQIMSSSALLVTVLPLSVRYAPMVAVILMGIYVLSGGVWATGLIGTAKIILTVLSLMLCGGFALYHMGGPAGIATAFPRFPWFSLFGRGVNQDLAAAFSLFVGVLSSQIYFQAVLAAGDVAKAKRGALLSAVIGPLIGLAGIMVGLFMRINHPDIIPAQALPLFVLGYLNPWLAGVVLATLLLAAVGTGAGLTLGVSTMLCRDIFQPICPNVKERGILLAFRLFIALILFVGLCVIYLAGGSEIILEWSYLSLGLRGATIFFPLLGVLYLGGKVSPQAGTLAVVAGPASVIAAGIFMPWELNPLYIGLVVSITFIIGGLVHKAYRKTNQPYSEQG
ncbi:Na+/solute symporter [Dethiobacter alkaliphilus AHT 1]|uniref:Na+/solute symporter n=2 Tax=Dethiobacter TaxID=427925 RepID=C0GHY7_DETAL|nr:Na+/solute symporter [Dethiobacter alkaliphilus AHT 1]